MVTSFPTTQTLSQRWTAFRALHNLDLTAGVFWLAILSFIVSTLWDLGAVSIIIGLAGTATCGFSWLFARSLFRVDAHKEVWPLAIVLALIVTGLLIDLLRYFHSGADVTHYALGFASNIHGLLSSTVLLLTFVEAFLGYHRALPTHEKRFRLIFASGYGALLLTSDVWLGSIPEGPSADQFADQVKIICSLIALGASVGSWWYRRSHALPRPKRQRRQLAHISQDDQQLATRLLQSLEQDRLYLDPDLRLPSLARRLGETNHRVSACITAILGFPNFNTLVNEYRIEAAKAALVALETRQQSILMIALDCGFSSIGPFNRAFKRETGLTPSEFRAQNLQLAQPS
ncbi:MAG: AraC family transcriptional regulator [Pseudomonadota bacterium]